VRKSQIKPPAVLTIVCVAACVLIVFAYESTYRDNTGIITEELSLALTEIYGAADGFAIVLNADGGVYRPDGVAAVMENGRGERAYEIIADGYEKGGVHVLVGLNAAGVVADISFIEIRETPGLGTKISDGEFLSQFTGLNADKLPARGDTNEKTKYTAVWGTREEIDALKAMQSVRGAEEDVFGLDVITGATYSSKGLYNAVETALLADGADG
jgi:electron transport complex protein RnfG